MKTFNLPDLGEGLPEAEIVKWHVSEGDAITADSLMVSVETAKAVVDVPAPYTGTIAKLYAAEGEMVETGKPLVDFRLDGEAANDAPPAEAPEAEAARDDSATVVGNVPTSDEVVQETAVAGRGRRGARGRIKAMPSIRAEAARLGIDLTTVTATGRNGQITQTDLQRHAGAAPAPAASPAAAPPAPAAAPSLAPASGETVIDPLRGPRRAMTHSMTRSRNEVMECTIFDDADIHAWRPGEDITARVLRAIAAGVAAEPAMNAWYDGEQLTRTLHSRVDVAMAVDGPQGLIVPVIRGVDGKSALALREDVNRLKVATRERSISPDDMRDPTIMLSNFGMLAGRYATPVVVPPCVAILGTGGVRHDVVAVMGGIEAHRVIPLSLTFDHRACTGGEACRFLAGVIADLALAD
ncbi:MAG: dihydrolipoamide acetyltransferase family protein [Pseudomonadota bacterium]